MKTSKAHSKTGEIGLFRVRVSIQSDGLFRAECLDLENCWVDASSLEEALADMQDVIALCLRADPPESIAPLKKIRLPIEISLPVALE